MLPFPVRGEYFLAAIFIAGMVYVWQLRRRLHRMVAADPSLRDGARALVVTVLTVILLTTVVQGLLQYFGGFSYDPAWWASCQLDNPFVTAELIFQVLSVCTVLWWVWYLDGAVLVQKYREALLGGYQNPFELSPTSLKWFLTLVPVGFLVMRGVAWVLMCKK